MSGGAAAERAQTWSRCRWRAAEHAKHREPRQMRDAARRSAPRTTRCVPPPSRHVLSQNTSIFAWCVSPQQARRPRVDSGAGAGAVCGGAVRCVVPVQAARGAGRARGPGGSRSEAGGRLASPCALSVHRCNIALANSRLGAGSSFGYISLFLILIANCLDDFEVL